MRFENAGGPFGAANRYDWANGSAGASILAAGGFIVEFDWTPAENTARDWISFQVGTVNADSGNLTNDDYGVLFRQDGDTERFDNSVNLGAGGSFPAPPGGTLRQIQITYEFSSFADGAEVLATSVIDGIEIASDTFTWDGNAGEMRMELGNNDPDGQRIDNLTISTIDIGGFIVSADSEPFLSSAPVGTPAATLSAAFDGVPETATYTFVPGDGDTDNGKFQIAGDEIQVGGGFDFLNEADGTTYSVRVGGTGDDSGQSGETVFTLTLIADSDADLLPDPWEIVATFGNGGNLTDLDGTAAGPGPGSGTGNFDGDSLTDLEEFQLNESGVGVSPVNAGHRRRRPGGRLRDRRGGRPPTHRPRRCRYRRRRSHRWAGVQYGRVRRCRRHRQRPDQPRHRW